MENKFNRNLAINLFAERDYTMQKFAFGKWEMVPWSRMDWTTHRRPLVDPNPHQLIFNFNNGHNWQYSKTCAIFLENNKITDIGFEILLPKESKAKTIKFEQPVYEWQEKKFHRLKRKLGFIILN